MLGILYSRDDRLYQVLSVLGEGGLFIYLKSSFDIAKNYVVLKPIYMIGLIDHNYIECYHNSIIPLKVLFLLCSYHVSIDILVD